jgi:hypothetical protein
MRGRKIIDCVEMKNRIQAALLSEYEGLIGDEERQRRQNRLATSDSPASKIWQAAAKRDKMKGSPR